MPRERVMHVNRFNFLSFSTLFYIFLTIKKCRMLREGEKENGSTNYCFSQPSLSFLNRDHFSKL